MPALSYTYSAFTTLTKIQSVVMNQYFTDIKTLLNTTKLDSTNIQTGGLATANYAANSVTAAKVGSGVATAGQSLVADGAGNSSFASTAVFPGKVHNIGFIASTSAGALTLTLKQADGATALSATAPGKVVFRTNTAYAGAVERLVTSGISIVVPSGALLGLPNRGDRVYIFLYAIDNGGTVELAVSGAVNTQALESISSTTILDTSSDTGSVLYSTTARTDVAAVLLGRVELTQTAGAYSAIVDWQLAPPLRSFERRKGVVSADYTMTESDRLVEVSAGAGAITITPPSSSDPGTIFTVKKTDSSSNAITVINLESGNYVLSNQYDSVSFQIGTGTATVVQNKSWNTVTKTANYTATVNDDLILCNTNAFTVTLPAATTRKKLQIKKIGSDANAITIARAGSDTIDGATSTTLSTQNEIITIVSDGVSAWYILSRDYPRTWTNNGASTITGSTSNPTKGTMSIDRILTARSGPNLEVIFEYYHTAAGAVGSGAYLILLPNSLTIDTSIYPQATVVGSWLTDDGSNRGTGSVRVYDSTHLYCTGIWTGGQGEWSNSFFPLSAATVRSWFRASVPISGWN